MKRIVINPNNDIPVLIKWHENEIKRLKAKLKTKLGKSFKSLPITKQIKLIIQEELKRPNPVYCYNDKRKNGTNRLKFQYSTTPIQFKKIQQRISILKNVIECIREEKRDVRLSKTRIIVRYKSV